MKTFQFHTELFDHRTTAIEALSAVGIYWFSDYSCVDLDHDEFGLEVCGIRDESTATRIAAVLRAKFRWPYSYWLVDDCTQDGGFMFRIHR